MKFKVYYDPRQCVAHNNSFSPSAGKASGIVDSWKKLGIPMEVCSYTPLSTDGLSLCHDRAYVEGILKGQTPNGYGNTSSEIIKALPFVAGSAVAATAAALTGKKPTFAPVSGAHHAGWARSGGFCTFNFIVISALIAKELGAKRVGIMDVDFHSPDGTEEIITRMDLDFITHLALGDNPPQPGKQAREWLDDFTINLLNGFDGCDVVIYNAGVDCAVSDPLGGCFTDDELAERDHRFFDAMKALGIGCSVFAAGGYERDKDGTIAPVLRRHDRTLVEAYEVWTSNDESDDSYN